MIEREAMGDAPASVVADEAKALEAQGPHQSDLIGGHGDYVWEEGKFANPPAKDLETWFIRGGSA
ncbi:MAG TPA: hypothetical protein PKE13_17100, partial [Hyphomicrobium zavarzinii]|nr:hypothetical protein [Hyphomicrobium zavarzinii]